MPSFEPTTPFLVCGISVECVLERVPSFEPSTLFLICGISVECVLEKVPSFEPTTPFLVCGISVECVLEKVPPFEPTTYRLKGRRFSCVLMRPLNRVCTELHSGKKEFVLIYDTLNTFYLRLYGVGHMVKDHSGSDRKEGNVLFNDALNTFYLRLYGIRHMVKDHSDSEKGNPLLPHRLFLSINSNVLLYAPSTGRITHTTAFVTPVVEHWLEREIAQREETCCFHYMGYSFRLTASGHSYAPSHRCNSTYHIQPLKHWLEREITQWVRHE